MSKSKQPRRLARAQAFQILYGLNFTPATTLGELMDAYYASPDIAAKDDEIESLEPNGFTWELIKGVWHNAKRLDEVISQHSSHWKVDRIGKIELTLLRLATYEMLYRSDVPPKVAINEALELSKQFGDDKSRGFVNGILDAAAKSLESGKLATA